MTLLTMDDFLNNYFMLQQDLRAQQPTSDQQQKIVNMVAGFAPLYYNTEWNPKNIPFDDNFGGFTVYLQTFVPGSNHWYFQAQLFVQHKNGNFGLFNLGALIDNLNRPYLVRDIAALAG